MEKDFVSKKASKKISKLKGIKWKYKNETY
jgi:hypothetical protein